MSNALSILASNVGTSEEEIKSVISNMIISAKAQHGASASAGELAVVTGICATYGLNPLMKEVHAFVSGGKLQVMIGLDGWAKLMTRHQDFDGVEFDYEWDGKNLLAVTAKIYRKSCSRPTCITEWMSECKQAKSDAWSKYPNRMLRGKALGQCVRFALGITEIIDDDEASRIAANSPREKDITPATKAIDWDAIKADMAECGDEASLNAVCVDLRSRLEADGQWAQAKATCILMKSEHQARIQSYAAQADAEQGEALEGEFEPAAATGTGDTGSPVEMEFE